MFIPINAKADIVGSKKGKLTPSQNAQLNAWCLASKTGILNCLDRCEAESLSYTVVNNVATIVFRKGYVSICGRLVECEAGTQVQVQAPSIGSTEGKIILKYNLSSSGEEEFKVTTTTEDLVQQDLNENTLTGVYEFELYSYVATSTSVSLTRNSIMIDSVSDKIDSIEERLLALGFKRGDVTTTTQGARITHKDIKKQGHYVICNFVVECDSSFGNEYIDGCMSEGFRPNLSVAFIANFEGVWAGQNIAKYDYVIIKNDGTFTLTSANIVPTRITIENVGYVSSRSN